MKRLLLGGGLAVAAISPLALAPTAQAADPDISLQAFAPAQTWQGASIGVRYHARNLEYHALQNVVISPTIPDQEQLISLNCGPLGRATGDGNCLYPYIPARTRVNAILRLKVCCVAGTDTEIINHADIAGTSIGASASTKIVPKPSPPPKPTSGIGLGLGVTIRIG